MERLSARKAGTIETLVDDIFIDAATLKEDVTELMDTGLEGEDRYNVTQNLLEQLDELYADTRAVMKKLGIPVEMSIETRPSLKNAT